MKAMASSFDISTEDDLGVERIIQARSDLRHGAATRVLIFDDEKPMRQALSRILRRKGRQVLTFSSPTPCSRCRCLPGESCADVILSDLSMPGLRGVDFVENQRGVGCRVPVFGLMSGTWTHSEATRARALDCRMFSKPFDSRGLRVWIDESTRWSARVLVDYVLRQAGHGAPNV